MAKPKALILFLLGIWGICLFNPDASRAKESYARQTGQGCIFCHQESMGGQLKTAGFAYIRNGYHYPISESVLAKAEALQGKGYKTLRFMVGYLHLLAAVIFFGAIFYIHIFVRPGRLTGGIPKPERALGLTCMIVLALTGSLFSLSANGPLGPIFQQHFWSHAIYQNRPVPVNGDHCAIGHNHGAPKNEDVATGPGLGPSLVHDRSASL